MTATYPPERHLLRDLGFSFDAGADERSSHAWLPVVPEICGPDGRVQAGPLCTLVDVIGGGLAAVAARPNWIATADLTLHVASPPQSGTVEARAHVLRAGRTTVVLEVDLLGDEGGFGIATMSFSVLPRRETNPDIDETRPSGMSSMVVPGSGLQEPFSRALGIEVVDAAGGVVELPVLDWARNSMGALQGGAVGAVAEQAALVALERAAEAPLAVSDLQLTYLSFGRVGPLRTTTEVLHAEADRGVAHVQLFDVGADGDNGSLAPPSVAPLRPHGRLMTVARVVASRRAS